MICILDSNEGQEEEQDSIADPTSLLSIDYYSSPASSGDGSVQPRISSRDEVYATAVTMKKRKIETASGSSAGRRTSGKTASLAINPAPAFRLKNASINSVPTLRRITIILLPFEVCDLGVWICNPFSYFF